MSDRRETPPAAASSAMAAAPRPTDCVGCTRKVVVEAERWRAARGGFSSSEVKKGEREKRPQCSRIVGAAHRMSAPKEDPHWNSWRNVEAKRLLRPNGAKGAKQLAAHMSEAGSIVVNLVPLSGDEMRALSEGLRRARGMTCIRLVREARGGGLPVRTTKALQSRQLASSVAARARAASGGSAPTAGRSQEDVLPLLGQRVAEHVARSKTLLELEVGVDLGVGAMAKLGNAIARSQSLRVVSFKDSEMGDASFSALVDGVRRNANLRDVDLSGCCLTDASDAAVASVVRARAGRRAVEAWERNLRRYDDEDRTNEVSSSPFGGDERDDDLSGTDQKKLGLARLELSYNELGAAAVEAMCVALRQDVELRQLGMRACLVSDADAARLGKTMREHPALELVALGQSRVAGADLGALRAEQTPMSSSSPSADAKGKGAKARETKDCEDLKKRRDVYMDMEWTPGTPRANAEALKRDAARRAEREAARRADKNASFSKTRPATARSEKARLEMETRRGWSPASGATASKWHDMGTHTSAARPHSALPKSPFAPRTNVDAETEGGGARRKRESDGGGGGAPSLRASASAAAGFGAWTRPTLGRSKASVVLSDRKPFSRPSSVLTSTPAGASSEKMLVHSLTKALQSLARSDAAADPEALRRRVAAAARAAQTASELAEFERGEDYGGTKSARMMARVRADMRALREAE